MRDGRADLADLISIVAAALRLALDQEKSVLAALHVCTVSDPGGAMFSRLEAAALEFDPDQRQQSEIFVPDATATGGARHGVRAGGSLCEPCRCSM
jgi:hypothetical protein